MTMLYGLAAVVGLILLLVWTVTTAVGRDTTRLKTLPPYIAVAIGFGLAGLSASYAGWPTMLGVVAAALAGLAALGWVLGTRAARKS